MTISRIGVLNSTGTTDGSGTLTIDLSSLSIQQNDFVIVSECVGSVTSDVTRPTLSGNNNGAYAGQADLFANSTADTNLFVWALKQGATVDTSVSATVAGGAGTPYAYTVSVYRGVDTTTPLDVALTTATGTTSDLANPPAITPATANSLIVAIYAGSQNTSTSWGSPSNISNFVQAAVTTGVGKKGIIATGDATWTSGAFDPAAIPTGDGNAGDSWAAVTLALRAVPSALVMASAVGASLAGAVTITPRTALTVANDVAASLADALTLTAKTALILNSAISAGLTDNVTLSPKTALTVANGVAASLADSLTVTFHNASAAANSAISASLTPNVTLSSKYVLTVANGVSASLAGAVVLGHTLAGVNNAVSASLADNITTSYFVSLVITSAISAGLANNVDLTAHATQIIWIGKDPTTGNTLATNPGTTILQGKFANVTIL